MRIFKYLLLSAALTGGFAACSDYDDAWIKEAIEDLKDRVTALEDWCKTANSNIASLQTLVSAIEKRDYITGVIPVTENGKEIGYTLSFNNYPSIIIYHGKNGTDGGSPVIGVGKGNDGKYYWTQTVGDAEPVFILDSEGNKIAASAISPRLSVDSEGYWMIDTDGSGYVRMKDSNGKDVKAVGDKGDKGDKGDTGASGSNGGTGPAGPAGDSIFDSIDNSNPDYVVITLKDGTIIKISKLPVIHVAQAGGLKQALKDAGVEATSVKELTISGTLGDADFQYIRENLTKLEKLDLSLSDITVLPDRALAFYSGMGLSGNTTLKEVLLPEGLTTIGNSAFAMCKALKSVNIPSTITTFGRWMFEGAAVESVTIPAGVIDIPASCFYGSAFTSIEIPANVKTIGHYAFQSSSLTSITIPSTVVSVGVGAFYGCTELKTAQIDANLTEIQDDMFYGCSKLTTVDLPESLTAIRDDAFNGCPLEVGNGNLVIPSKVKTIGARAFALGESNNVTAVTFPEGLEVLEQAAFYGCTKIREVILPASLKKMNDSAFYWTKVTWTGTPPNQETDPYVRNLTFKGSTPPEIIYTYSADDNPVLLKPNVRYMADCTVYVPAEAVDIYKASVWFNGTDAYDRPDEYPKGCDYFKAENIHGIGESE